MADTAITRRVFRSAFWRAFAILWAAFVLFNVADIALRGFPRGGITALAAIAPLSVLVYAVAWRPAVVADSDSVEIRNPLRTVRIAWSSVTGISVTDSLRVITRQGVFRSWATGSGGAVSNLMRGVRGRNLANPRRLGGGLGLEREAIQEFSRESSAGYTAAALREMWNERADRVEPSVRKTLAWPTVSSFCVTVVILAAVIMTQ